jgi:hypothetical protein
MKRIETPLQASIRLDAFNCPVTFTGKNALQVQSPQWLRVMYTCLTKPHTLFASFLPVFLSFPGYNHFIKNSSGVRTSAYLKPIK